MVNDEGVVVDERVRSQEAKEIENLQIVSSSDFLEDEATKKVLRSKTPTRQGSKR